MPQPDPETIATLTEAMNEAADPDWFQALLGAALDQVRGDLKKAIPMAREMMKKHPRPPAEEAT
jgi:hypothetical protein